MIILIYTSYKIFQKYIRITRIIVMCDIDNKTNLIIILSDRIIVNFIFFFFLSGYRDTREFQNGFTDGEKKGIVPSRMFQYAVHVAFAVCTMWHASRVDAIDESKCNNSLPRYTSFMRTMQQLRQ